MESGRTIGVALLQDEGGDAVRLDVVEQLDGSLAEELGGAGEHLHVAHTLLAQLHAQSRQSECDRDRILRAADEGVTERAQSHWPLLTIREQLALLQVRSQLLQPVVLQAAHGTIVREAKKETGT